MENWIIRFVAVLCAIGGTALLWILGVFLVVPWREGRLLALNLAELQMIGVSLIIGLAVIWGGATPFRARRSYREPEALRDSPCGPGHRINRRGNRRQFVDTGAHRLKEPSGRRIDSRADHLTVDIDAGPG